MIYFIKSQTDGYVKIGYTEGDTKKRLSCIQSSSPLKLDLLKVISGDRILEKGIHTQYEKYRIHGEWFKFPGYIIDQIKNNRIDGVEASPGFTPGISLDVKKVKTEMRRQGLTGETVGKAMGTTRHSVSHFLNNPSTLTLKTVSRIADAINVEPIDLIL